MQIGSPMGQVVMQMQPFSPLAYVARLDPPAKSLGLTVETLMSKDLCAADFEKIRNHHLLVASLVVSSFFTLFSPCIYAFYIISSIRHPYRADFFLYIPAMGARR